MSKKSMKKAAISILLMLAMFFGLISPLAAADGDAPKVVSMEVYTGHGGTVVGDTDDQYIILNATFDQALKMDDREAAKGELTFIFNSALPESP